jgi:7-cyano-7-deazaguanine synthase
MGRFDVRGGPSNNKSMPAAAIILLSGGLDSATVAAIARADGLTLHALSFRYGQRHAVEIDAAKAVAAALGACEHVIAEIDLRVFGGSALTDEIEVPKEPRSRPGSASRPHAVPQSGGQTDAAHGAFAPDESEIPITYVPARNTIFLSYALAFAETRAARDIYIGVNAVDYSGYPDCRPEYIDAFAAMAALATRAGVEGRPVRIHTPLMEMTKDQIIRRGMELGVDYGLTRSCYDPDPTGAGCRLCESCRLRLAAFEKLGMRDPAPYC